MFELLEERLDPDRLRADLVETAGPSAGAIVTFEGRVRERSAGREVARLEYEAYPRLAVRRGREILGEVGRRHPLEGLGAAQRTGVLEPGELAVWIGVAAAHRGAAFDACRRVIDRFKTELPVWKREVFRDGETRWVGPPDVAAGEGVEAREEGRP